MKIIKELKRFIEELKQLPTLSPVALRIVDVVGNENSSISELTKLIESDQGLSSKILQISNYTLSKSERHGDVKTVKHATSILGMNIIRSIALSVIVVNLFESSSDKTFNVVEFWRHSAACAITSDLLARKLSYTQPEEAFIAGLLHDLGKLLLFQWKKADYLQVVKEANKSKARLLELEEKILGIGHTHAAKLLMQHWKFPELLTNVAWLHHQPISEFGTDCLKQLPFIVSCANSLCHIQRFGDSGNPVSDLSIERLNSVIGMSSHEINELSSDVLNLFEDVAKNYDWKVNTPDLYLSAVARANQELFYLQNDSRETKRQLIIQQHLNKLIYELHDSLSLPMPVWQALAKATDMLGEVIPYKRVLGFVLLEKDELIDGWVKLNTKSEGERITLYLNERSPGELTRLRLREQIYIIEQLVNDLGDKLNVGSEIVKALQSANIKVQPLYVGGKTIGLIVIELAPFNWSHHEKIIFIRKYATAVSIALDRLILYETVDEQSEELARLARKIDRC